MFEELKVALTEDVAGLVEVLIVALVFSTLLFMQPWAARKVKDALEENEKRQYENWNRKNR